MPRKVIVLFSIILLSSIRLFSQSYDEKITDAMNRSDWFELDSIYNMAPKDSVSEFLEVYSRCLIGNRLNRNDISIPAFYELFDYYSRDMSMDNLVNTAIMFAMDLSRDGQNEAAANMLSSIIKSVSYRPEKSRLKHLQQFFSLYKGLANYSPYKVVFEDDSLGVIPFKIVAAGPKEKDGKQIVLKDSSINGNNIDIIFDTGASINIITDSLAQKFNLLPLYADMDVKGIGSETGRFVIAKELKIGNIVVYDVPFLVLSMTSKNADAEKYLKKMNLIVGSELMLQLKDLTLDFQNNQITVPTTAPEHGSDKPNMCFSSTMNLLAAAEIDDTPLLMRIDTGDASFGILDYAFFKKHEKLIKKSSKEDTVRIAGIGGVNKTKSYKTANLQLILSGKEVTVPLMDVIADKKSKLKNNLGLKSLMLFNKVRFNMIDFVISTD